MGINNTVVWMAKVGHGSGSVGAAHSGLSIFDQQHKEQSTKTHCLWWPNGFFCLDLWASSISFIPLQFFNVRKKPPYFLTDILSLMHKALMLLFTENLAFHPRSEILLVFSHFQTRTNQIFVNFLLFLLLILFKKMQKTKRNEQKMTKNGYTHWKQ